MLQILEDSLERGAEASLSRPHEEHRVTGEMWLWARDTKYRFWLKLATSVKLLNHPRQKTVGGGTLEWVIATSLQLLSQLSQYTRGQCRCCLQKSRGQLWRTVGVDDTNLRAFR